MEKHTKLPWRVGYSDGSGRYSKVNGEYTSSITKNNSIVATTWDNDPPHCEEMPPEMNALANAAFIVKACNNHYQLLEALKEATTEIQQAADSLFEGGCGGQGFKLTIAKYEAVIKQAESDND